MSERNTPTKRAELGGRLVSAVRSSLPIDEVALPVPLIFPRRKIEDFILGRYNCR